MINKRGFTLVELLVAVVAGGLVILTAGTVSSIGKTSHQKLFNESGIYNDIAYVFKLIQNRVHMATTISSPAATSPWVGTERLIVGNEAFGVYNETGPNTNLVYLSDKDNVNTRQTILIALDTDTLDLSINPDEPIGDTVEVTLSGTKNGISFSMTTTIKGRRL